MLKFHAISKDLLGLLRKVMAAESCKDFYFGGGSSLALRFGHRRSFDIDLFTAGPFNTEETLQNLKTLLPEPEIINRTPGSLCLMTAGSKLDFLLHTYPHIGDPETIDDIRFLSCRDLAAMKINAVTNRGSRKDFADLLCLHDEGITLEMSLTLYEEKYGHAGKFMALRSLVWFEDADAEPELIYLNGWTWPEIRSRMKSLAAMVINKNR